MEKITLWKLLWIYLKNRLRYPFLKRKLGDLEPNVYFGFTDHPLDVKGTPIINMFNALSKLFRKKSKFIFEVELKERVNNSFRFTAKAYNLFTLKSLSYLSMIDLEIKPMGKPSELLLQFDFLRSNIYRLRLAEGPRVLENQTPMIINDLQDPLLEIQLEEKSDKYIISSSELRLEIYKVQFRIDIFDSAGRQITESGGRSKSNFPNAMDAFPLGFIMDKQNPGWFGVESFVLYPGEAIYGLGEQFGPLNKIGKTIGLWNADGSGNTSGRVYKNIPFFLSTHGYGVFINESRPTTFWVGSRDFAKIQIAIEGNSVDYFFFHGSIKRILNDYTHLTGKAAIPPKFSFGVWMSRISYSSQAEVLEVASKLRALKFPCDVIHIDTNWFEEDWKCDWQFGKQKFPDPQQMFIDLRSLGFRVSLWQAPYVIKQTGIYKDAKKRHALAKNNAPFQFMVIHAATPIDFSRPEGVAWYQDKLKHLLELGASVIKTDFGEQIEPPMQFMKYKGRQMHNIYALLYTKAAFEITEKTCGEGIIWARSAYAGSQRYPVHWSGDNSSNFENLLCSLRGGLSLGLCGFTYWSQDTGGFIGTPTDDLYVRWTQLAIFQSHIRYHGMGPRFREPWNYEPATQELVRKYLNFRYQLIPYIYSECQIAAKQGLPLLRHLVIEFQNDPTTFNLEDQFLCGRNLLIAPILTKNNTRMVYLPEGTWYDYWTGEQLTGPQWITQTCDLSSIPIFVHAGSILPLGAEVQCTDELTNDWFLLKIYPDSNGAASYEIMDKENRIQISAQIENDTLNIEMIPKPKKIEVDIPKSLSISAITINGESINRTK